MLIRASLDIFIKGSLNIMTGDLKKMLCSPAEVLVKFEFHPIA